MSVSTNELMTAVDQIKAHLLEEESEPLAGAAASQLTRMMCIANFCLDVVIDDAIQRYLEIRDDIVAFRQAPKVLFDQYAIGPLLRDICTRKKRDRKYAEERLSLLGISKISAGELKHVDFDFFQVESTQPVCDSKYHDAVCKVNAPAFTWMDQYGNQQVRHGSVSVYIFDPEHATKVMEEVACG